MTGVIAKAQSTIVDSALYCFEHRSWSNHPSHCGCRKGAAIHAIPAIPDPWVFDFRGLHRYRDDKRWYFTIRCDEGSTIASGPRAPKIAGFECYFVGHTPTWTSYSYREVIA